MRKFIISCLGGACEPTAPNLMSFCTLNRSVLSPFPSYTGLLLVSDRPFWNGSVFTCVAAASTAAK